MDATLLADVLASPEDIWPTLFAALPLPGCGIGDRVRDLLRERFGHRVYIWP